MSAGPRGSKPGRDRLLAGLLDMHRLIGRRLGESPLPGDRVAVHALVAGSGLADGTGRLRVGSLP
jgi:hypothetical protein